MDSNENEISSAREIWRAKRIPVIKPLRLGKRIIVGKKHLKVLSVMYP